MLKSQHERWGNLVNHHLLKHGFDPVVNMRNWRKRDLKEKPDNYTMKQINNSEFKDAYNEMVTTKRELNKIGSLSTNHLSLSDDKKRKFN